MNIILYNFSGEQIELDKTNKLTLVETKTGTFRGEIDTQEPVFDVAGNITDGVNYAYIADFGRYYYVHNPTIFRTGITRLFLTVDPLHTFREQIKPLKAIAKRTADRDKQTAYIVDSKLPFAAYKKYRTFDLGQFTDTAFMILITAG